MSNAVNRTVSTISHICFSKNIMSNLFNVLNLQKARCLQEISMDWSSLALSTKGDITLAPSFFSLLEQDEYVRVNLLNDYFSVSGKKKVRGSD